MVAEVQIKNALMHALATCGIEISAADIPLEHPGELAHGDYATGIALAKSHLSGMNPRALAEKIVAAMGTIDSVSKVEIAGPGFINFTLTNDVFAKTIEDARSHSSEWGKGDADAGKTIMMEYTDPNPFKEFHIGHLVPNALGESIARIFEFSGAKVYRANYQGDVGVHVAKSLFIQMEEGITDPTIADLSRAYPEGSKRYEEDEAAKKAIDQLNKVIYEKSDPAVNALYEKGRTLSLAHFEDIYKVLGTKFDFYFFESDTGPRGLKVVKAHPEIFVESDGAIVFKGEEYGLHTRVFVNRIGLPTYEAKDIGLVEAKREKCSFDFSLTITGNEQADYFKVVSCAISLVFPEMAGKIFCKTNGMLRFSEGKMSSRTGNIITGEALLADLAESALVRAAESRAEDSGKLAQDIAVGAIKYQILRQASGTDIIFDRQRALSFEGDSGPYLQYAHARTCAIMQKSKDSNVSAAYDATTPTSDLVRVLARFPEVAARAAAEREPHYVATYLLSVAAMFNSWYAQEQILDGTPSAAHKVAIVDAVRATLKNGLWLLGIPTPEQM